MASSNAALSRTERVIAWRRLTRPTSSPAGARDARPRLGLSPKTPQHEAGMRIEPAPSPPLAAGTMPAATAAAEPPDEPPTVRSSAHGFRVGPKSTGSVVEWLPTSGVLVRPTMMRPAFRYEVTIGLSTSGRKSRSARDPAVCSTPACPVPRALSRKGTPASGPAGNGRPASASASSKRGVTTALMVGFTASIRAIAARTSSAALISFRRTRPASPTASRRARSLVAGAALGSVRRQRLVHQRGLDSCAPVGRGSDEVPDDADDQDDPDESHAAAVQVGQRVGLLEVVDDRPDAGKPVQRHGERQPDETDHRQPLDERSGLHEVRPREPREDGVDARVDPAQR